MATSTTTTPLPGLKNILAFSRLVVAAPYGTSSPIELMIARYLVATLGEADPDVPGIEVCTGAIIIPHAMVGTWKPAQIAAMARSMLLAAERAQEQQHEQGTGGDGQE